MRHRLSRNWTAPVLAFVLTSACGTGGGGQGNPVQPILPPTIGSIDPANAAPGDRVTIRGANFAGNVVVSFDGVRGQVLSASDTLVIAILPEVAAGDHSVVVSVASSSSQPFRYRVAPARSPVITAIQPEKAHVGERVVITGMNFGGSGNPDVEFAGVGAITESFTDSRIVAFVPVLGPGATSVTVRSRTASPEFPYEILHSPPAIVSVVSNPTRAGLWITIRGAYLAGREVSVLVDGLTAEVRRQNATTQLTARVPDVAVGEHELRVKVDGDLSAPFSLRVDDFSAAGVYQVHGVVVRTYGLLPGCPLPAVGEQRDVQIELFDNRPELVARIGTDTRQYVGTIDSQGRISLPAAQPPPIFPPLPSGASIRGLVTLRASDGRLEIDVTISRSLDFCFTEEHLTGLRLP